MPKLLEKKDKNQNLENMKNECKFARVRGMRDILPDEYRFWDFVERKAIDITKTYGFKRLEIPVLEKIELYERSTGKETDIVTKEMYDFVDKGGERVAMRPEATPSLARVYIEHGMLNYPQPVKMCWIGSLFRYERPQAGRYRQLHQIDLEIFGEASPVADAQLMMIAYNFFKELQINTEIQINSIGCAECRKVYIDKLKEFFKQKTKKGNFCDDCKKRSVKNPLRILDCKEKECIENLEDAPQIIDSLCDLCRTHFVKVLELLDGLSVPYNLNPFLVRGLDYYTRTVFEIWPTDESDDDESNEGSRNFALGGGGRYDALVEYLGGRQTPACGLGIGLERTILKIKEKNISLQENNKNLIFVAQIGDQARRVAMLLFEDLRKAGFNIAQSFTKDGLRAQLEEANRSKARLSLILGQKEVADGMILIRDMDSGVQEAIDLKKVVVELEKRLKE